MSNLDTLLEQIKKGDLVVDNTRTAPVERTTKVIKAKEKTPAEEKKYVNDKHYDEIRGMFHFLMFQNRVSSNEARMLKPMYENFSRDLRLSPKQLSFVSNLWIQYKSKGV